MVNLSLNSVEDDMLQDSEVKAEDQPDIELVTVESELQKKMDGYSKVDQVYLPSKQRRYGSIKYLSLMILTIQNAALSLSMRYARTREGVDMFSSPAAVFMSEVVKLFICIGLVMQETGHIVKGAQILYKTVIQNILDTLRVGVPAFLYVVQNNLLYVSASNLDAATYQVTYQLKLLTTAFFAVLVLKRKLKNSQWGALILLAIGVACVQLSSTKENKAAGLEKQSRVLGFSAALAACFISGFAGIYFEKVLKESDVSVWMRNVQLSLLSLPFAAITYAIDTRNDASPYLLKGFDGFVWYLVILQAAGGLIVAVVVKYADNILKGFATSVAIIISCIASIYLFGFQLTIQFAAGTVLVIGSIFLYGYVPKKPETRSLNPVSSLACPTLSPTHVSSESPHNRITKYHVC